MIEDEIVGLVQNVGHFSILNLLRNRAIDTRSAQFKSLCHHLIPDQVSKRQPVNYVHVRNGECSSTQPGKDEQEDGNTNRPTKKITWVGKVVDDLHVQDGEVFFHKQSRCFDTTDQHYLLNHGVGCINLGNHFLQRWV